MPTSLPPSTTGRAPNFLSTMMRTASQRGGDGIGRHAVADEHRWASGGLHPWYAAGPRGNKPRCLHREPQGSRAMKVRILAIGKDRSGLYRPAVEEYLSRSARWMKVSLIE